MHQSMPRVSLVFVALLPCAAYAQEQEDPLKPFLSDIAPGPQSANEMLNIAHTAVTSLQSAQDWLGVIGTATGDGNKEGFGLAFTPGRSDIRALAVSARDYADSNRWLKRLWGATTLSYAQNKAEYSSADYRQSAFFVQTTYYIEAMDDPVVAGYQGVKTCVKDKEKSAEFNNAVIQRLAAERKLLGRDLSDADFRTLEEKIKKEESGTMSLLASANKETRDCAKLAIDKATAKWNATRVGLAVGKGWIKGAAGGSQRLSLGEHLSLSAAIAPKGWDNSLFNVTIRLVRREVDLQTLATTPQYKSNTQAALRYTYNAGSARNVYALAEVSSVGNSEVTQSSTAFKQALGLDYKVRKGMWLEFRWGRAREANGSGTENRGLVNFKFSPEAGLASLLGG